MLLVHVVPCLKWLRGLSYVLEVMCVRGIAPLQTDSVASVYAGPAVSEV